MLPVKYDAKAIQRELNTVNITASRVFPLEAGAVTLEQTIVDLTSTVGNVSASVTSLATTTASATQANASLITTVQANVDTVAAAVVTEATARADADSAEAIARQAVQANVDTVSAAVVTEATARANADSANASLITTLTADLATANGNISNNYNISVAADNVLTQSINSLSATVGQNTSAISTEATARANADSASAALITQLNADVATANGNIANNYTISVNADNALSQSINTVSASVGNVAASVTAEATARANADGVLEAKYGVSLNSNGYITGFSQNNDGTSGTFKILADKFTIIDPAASGSGLAGTQVFDITNGVVTMEAAHIKNLTVGNMNGSLNSVSAFQGSGSKTFGPTSSGYVLLLEVDCPAATDNKAHIPHINMAFDGAFATDTAYVKLDYAVLTNGSPGAYSTIQTMRNKTSAGGNSWTTIPVVGSAPSTTSAIRFKVSIKMFADNGTSSTNQSRTGTAHWSGTTIGIV